MGFLLSSNASRSTAPKRGGLSVELLHQAQCNACPLNYQKCKTPHMEPSGVDDPLVYMLGNAPNSEEDKAGEHFQGDRGDTLEFHLDHHQLKALRWNYIVRTMPPGGRDPVFVEIECCRPSVVKDIEQSQPKAIFAFGKQPLEWALGMDGGARIDLWRGRHVPAVIGKHPVWVFPMLDPQVVFDSRRKDRNGDPYTPRRPRDFCSDIEFAFLLDIERAFRILRKLPEPVVHTIEMAEEGVEWVTGHKEGDLGRVEKFLLECYDNPITGLDYETDRIRPYAEGATVLTAALSGKNGTLAFPFYHKDAGWSKKQAEELEDRWAEFMVMSPTRKVVHNLAFEQEWSAEYFEPNALDSSWGCSMAQAYVLDERVGHHIPMSLDFLCLQHFGFNIKAMSKLDRANLAGEELESVLRYNGLDSKYHRLLYNVQARLLKEEGLTKVYERHVKRIKAMVLTQIKGVPVNQDTVKELRAQYTKDLHAAEDVIFELPLVRKYEQQYGKEFRPSAAGDVKKLFKLDGVFLDSTKEAELKATGHALAKPLLAWKKAEKVLSTYLDPVTEGSPQLYGGSTLHSILSTCNTVTSRTSSEDPNSQNFPKRGPAKIVRRVVKPGPRKRVVAFDYAGIQARNVAMESKDKVLVAAFWDRYDVHTDWLDQLVKLYPAFIKEGVTAIVHDKKLQKSYRDVAKNGFVFPSFFGAQPTSISTGMGVPKEIIEKLHKAFWDRFPDIKKWHKHLHEFFREHGYVTGLSGYRRRAPCSPNELINAPIQADEAIIVCSAMSRLSEMGDWRFQPNMEIHDDLTFIWDYAEIERNAEVVITEMCRLEYDWINVPLQVEMSVGETWCDLEAAGEYASDTWNGRGVQWPPKTKGKE